MSTKAQFVKSQKEPKFSSRVVRRCWKCGRTHGYMKKFGLCRICFRELAEKGDLPGITRSSW